MTQQPPSGSPPSPGAGEGTTSASSAGTDPEGGPDIDACVADFLSAREGDPTLTPAAFVLRYEDAVLPDQLAEIRAACAEALAIADLIERERPPILPPSDLDSSTGSGWGLHARSAAHSPAVRASLPGSPGDATPGGGQRIGEYELLSEIGRGGMGVVYLAYQSSLDRKVALKVLPYSATQLGRHVERFKREARAIARLTHPGIVPILAVGEADGVHHFAMEYVEGESLSKLIARWREERAELRAQSQSASHARRGPVDVTFAARIAAEVAEALHYAHGQGIVHRDVKPQNVLLDHGGRARLVDFGLAKAENSESLTQSGDITGTPFYMSPEQAHARRAPVGPRSDVFSLGVVLYELLTLERPFQGETVHQVLFEISYRMPQAVRKLNPKVHKDLETICHKALEKNLEHRYATAGELGADLRRFLAHEAIRARPPSLVELLRRKLVRHQAIAATVLAALVVIATVLASTSRRVEAKVLAREVLTAREFADLAPEEIEALPAAELARLHQSLTRVATLTDGRDERLPAGDRAPLAALRTTAAEQGASFKMRFLELVGDKAPRRSAARTLEVEELFDKARALLPEDRDLERFEELRPQLTLTSDRPGDLVRALPIDVEDGTLGLPQDLGTTPIAGVAVPPGFYRVVVERPGFGSAEVTLDLTQYRQTETIDVTLRSDDVVLRDMIAIPEGPYRYGIPGQSEPFYREREETLELFYIDRTEVSNAEYKAFLDATGHRAPELWQGSYQTAWGDLPVVGVSYADAAAYALWAGKRLPTAREWEKAARGAGSRVVPWDEGEDRAAHAVLGGNNSGPGLGDSRAATFARYLDHVRPVTIGAPGPYGLVNTLGNVAEWTETPFVRVTEEGRIPTMDERLVKGGAWESPQKKWDLTVIAPEKVEAHLNNTYGFRCAKSAPGGR